jgi:hypothetical protein
LLRLADIGQLVSGSDVALQIPDFTALLQHIRQHGDDANRCTGGEKYQQHKYQRRLPFVAEKIVQGNRLIVFDGEAEQYKEYDYAENPIKITHEHAP